eukprot:SAG31_NODE_2711_length_5208_cov_12.009395_3_plen_135_part_00
MWRLQALLQPSHDIAGSTAWNNAVYNASAAVRDNSEYQAPEPATYEKSRERKNAPRNVSGKELRPCAEPFEEWTSHHVHDWLSTSVKLPEIAERAFSSGVSGEVALEMDKVDWQEAGATRIQAIVIMCELKKLR